jgi:hypothetical protein
VDDKPYRAEAQVLGGLAVHRCVNPALALWVVSSLTTGYMITSCRRQEEALRIAEYLHQEVGPLFLARTPASIRSRLERHQWVIPWCIACHDKGAWVDPESFR